MKTVNFSSRKLWFLFICTISLLITPLYALSLNSLANIFEDNKDNFINSREVTFESSGGQYEIGDEVCVDIINDNCQSKSTTTVTYSVQERCLNTRQYQAFYTITARDFSNPFCANLEISSKNNQLNIDNITITNVIAKVFDPNWKIIYNCSSNCPETISIPDLISGEVYHTDIQFYDKNWQFICADKQDIIIEGGNEPCDTSICQGDVVLRTQAEIDAFCGCEVIKGDLIIRKNDNIEGIPADIFSLETLKGLKRIEGGVIIQETQIKNYAGLEALNYIGSGFASVYNYELRSFIGLENLKVIGDNLTIQDNYELVDIKGFQSLSIVGSQIYIDKNNKLETISGFPNLTEIGNLRGNGTLNIYKNDSLKEIKGFEKLQDIINLVVDSNNVLTRIGGFNSLSNVRNIYIVKNHNLVELPFINNLNSIVNEIAISKNSNLTDCCFFSRFLDNDIENGHVLDTIVFEGNGNFCNSPDEIIQNCQDPLSTCENIQIITQNNQIIIDGLTAPNQIVKVFDKDYNIVFECNGNCDDRQITGIFPEGNYVIDLQLYDENWEFICAEQRNVALETDGEPCDTSICAGNVILRTQAEVDDFCGCEVIEGDLIIGYNDISITDVNDLSNLSSLKLIKGNALINGTSLNSLKSFNKLSEIGSSFIFANNNFMKDFSDFIMLSRIGGDILIDSNDSLINLKGLHRLDSIVGLTVHTNKSLKNLDSLLNLRFLGYLNSYGTPLENIKFLRQIENNSIGLLITGNSFIENLEGLENFETLSRITLGGNTKLVDISILQNIKLVTGNLTIEQNPNLEDCCSIRHLVDSDTTNGRVLDNIKFVSNGGSNSQCEYVYRLLEQCPNIPISSCKNIQINAENNQITLSNVVGSNTIIKVFDSNWQLIYDCTATCENELVVPVESEGVYHTDVQFYDENWMFICEDRQDIEVINGSEPCDTSICQGDVILQTQAEVDAFCGCEVIEGRISIGANESDITNLHNLIGIKNIKGSMFIAAKNLENLVGLDSLVSVGGVNIIGNSLESLKGLESLSSINGFLRIGRAKYLKNVDELANVKRLGGALVLEHNSSLESLAGLNQLDSITSITIVDNKSLYDFNELENLTYLNEIFLSGTNITDLKFFKKIKTVQPHITISANDTLMNLEGLEHFDTLGSLTLGANGKLNDVSAIKDVHYVKDDLIIEFNKQLSNCCIIKKLLDSRGGYPFVRGEVRFGANKSGSSCNDVIQFYRQCPDPISPCEITQIQSTNSQLSITNLSAPIEILKVFDANYSIIYECYADCEDNLQLPNLTAGTYHININFYDKNWQLLCEKNETVQIEESIEDRNSELSPNDFTLHPNPAQEATYINLQKLTEKEAKLTLINQFGQEVWQKSILKVGVEKERIDLNRIANGIYFLQIQTPSRKSIAKKLIVNRLY